MPFVLHLESKPILFPVEDKTLLSCWGRDNAQTDCMEQGRDRGVTEFKNSPSTSLTIFPTVLLFLVSLPHPFPEDLMLPILEPL